MNKPITIKPHHFLDIIKLYGKGIEVFVPDKKYIHDFYKIGNIILKNKRSLLTLTLGYDDICRPCVYLKDGKCTDAINDHGPYTLKEEWNRTIDTRLFMALDLKEGEKITAIDFCYIVQNKLNVFKIWKEESHSLAINREKYLFQGLKKYINNQF